MTKNNEFDKDFDFEKEYGFDPNTLLDPEFENEEAMQLSFDASMDEELGAEFDAKFDPDFDERFSAEFGDDVAATLTEMPHEAKKSDTPKYTEPAFDLPTFDESIIDQSAFEDVALDEVEMPKMESDLELEPAPEASVEEVSAEEAPQEVPAQEEAPAETDTAPNPRRKPLSRERLIKEVYLPPIIAGITALLCLIFMLSGVTRWIKTGITNRQNEAEAIASAENEKTRLQQESERLLAEAELLASGYDYQGAIDKLNSFSDAANMDQYTEMIDARAAYSNLKNQLQAWNDPSSVANLSFQMLIADPERAYADSKFGTQYKNNFVTVSEFKAILEQLYNNGYVLVDFDSFVNETTADDGSITFSTNPIYLPSGKKPIMLTQTMVNYMTYMTYEDTREDEDNKYGDGFANKLVVRNGEITAEYYDPDGNKMYGAYDFIPILNEFIAEHPDFSYKGARALIAVTGEEGLFGYRTMASVIENNGQAYYDEQVEGAKEVINALRSEGYTIASYSYGNKDYKEFSATDIQADMDLWTKEVTPILGEVDTIVFARGTDISTGNNYQGNKFNVLYAKGIRYFVGAASVPWGEVNTTYVRQTRLMVTGTSMTNAASTYTSYFDAKSVLDSARTASAE